VCKCKRLFLMHLPNCKHYMSTLCGILLQYIVTNLCISLNWPYTCLTTTIGSGATIDAFDAKDARIKKLSWRLAKEDHNRLLQMVITICNVYVNVYCNACIIQRNTHVQYMITYNSCCYTTSWLCNFILQYNMS
jgi:hypothetical protein